jgi:hypothetical protein
LTGSRSGQEGDWIQKLQCTARHRAPSQRIRLTLP